MFESVLSVKSTTSNIYEFLISYSIIGDSSNKKIYKLQTYSFASLLKWNNISLIYLQVSS